MRIEGRCCFSLSVQGTFKLREKGERVGFLYSERESRRVFGFGGDGGGVREEVVWSISHLTPLTSLFYFYFLIN